jgi:hypothetical protein
LSDVVIDLRDTQYAAAIAILEGNFTETAQSAGNADSLSTDTPAPVAAGDDGKWPLQWVSGSFPCVSRAVGFLEFSRLQGDWNWLSQEWLVWLSVLARGLADKATWATNILLYDFTVLYGAKTPFGSANFNRVVNDCHLITRLI